MKIKELIKDPKTLYLYRKTAIEKLQNNHKKRKHQWKKSIDLAQKAAEILKDQFNVSKVALFGSILDLETFTEWSDIDLVVWGLAPCQTLLAMEEIQNLSDTIEINLVDINAAKPEIYQRILEKHQTI